MWFAAKLLFESSVPSDEGKTLQEESIRLIKARDEAEARANANILGNSEQHHYENYQGEEVAWQFVSILELQDLCESNLFDGMEVFSTLNWKTAEKQLSGSVHRNERKNHARRKR